MRNYINSGLCNLPILSSLSATVITTGGNGNIKKQHCTASNSEPLCCGREAKINWTKTAHHTRKLFGLLRVHSYTHRSVVMASTRGLLLSWAVAITNNSDICYYYYYYC